MQKSFITFTAIFILAVYPLTTRSSDSEIITIPEAPPETSTTVTSVAPSESSSPSLRIDQGISDSPIEVNIPSIKLRSTVIPVGVTPDGDMDVPSGNTQDVGWYKYGTIPGNIGNAVFDAHVFAAFADLENVKIGDDIYVHMQGGNDLHFIVTDVSTYALADVPVESLFGATDGIHLNLITCAGKLTPDRSTYDHRLIVYTTLVSA